MRRTTVLGVDSPPDLLRRFVALPIECPHRVAGHALIVSTNDPEMQHAFADNTYSESLADRAISCTLVLDDEIPLAGTDIRVSYGPIISCVFSEGGELHFDSARSSIAGLYRASCRPRVVEAIAEWIRSK